MARDSCIAAKVSAFGTLSSSGKISPIVRITHGARPQRVRRLAAQHINDAASRPIGKKFTAWRQTAPSWSSLNARPDPKKTPQLDAKLWGKYGGSELTGSSNLLTFRLSSNARLCHCWPDWGSNQLSLMHWNADAAAGRRLEAASPSADHSRKRLRCQWPD